MFSDPITLVCVGSIAQLAPSFIFSKRYRRADNKRITRHSPVAILFKPRLVAYAGFVRNLGRTLTITIGGETRARLMGNPFNVKPP